MRKLTILFTIGALFLLAGCGSDTVGSNPEMPPADQRPKTNRIDPPGVTPPGGQNNGAADRDSG